MAARLADHELQDLGRLLGDGSETHFSAMLVRLIRKADEENRLRLYVAYPDHVTAVSLWEAGGGCALRRCACGNVVTATMPLCPRCWRRQ